MTAPGGLKDLRPCVPQDQYVSMTALDHRRELARKRMAHYGLEPLPPVGVGIARHRILHHHKRGGEGDPLSTAAEILKPVQDFVGSFVSPDTEAFFNHLLGRGMAFDELVDELKKKGAYDPKALAAWIGRRKLGKKAFQQLAENGRRKKGGATGPETEEERMDREIAMMEAQDRAENGPPDFIALERPDTPMEEPQMRMVVHPSERQPHTMAAGIDFDSGLKLAKQVQSGGDIGDDINKFFQGFAYGFSHPAEAFQALGKVITGHGLGHHPMYMKGMRGGVRYHQTGGDVGDDINKFFQGFAYGFSHPAEAIQALGKLITG